MKMKMIMIISKTCLLELCYACEQGERKNDSIILEKQCHTGKEIFGCMAQHTHTKKDIRKPSVTIRRESVVTEGIV